MTLTATLRKNAVWFFGAYLVAALLAFWPRYLRDLGAVTNSMVHVHGIVLAVWLAMLVSQAALIRNARPALHRWIGRWSLVVAPLVVVTILSAAQVSLNRDVTPSPMRLAQLGLQCGSAVLFAIFYGLAIRYRRDVHRHARWMFCTVLTMTSPIFDRVLAFYVAPRSHVLPMFPDGSRILPAIHLVLLILAVWDWREGRRASPFVWAWGGFAAAHLFAWVAHTSRWWTSFALWFRGLPLS